MSINREIDRAEHIPKRIEVKANISKHLLKTNALVDLLVRLAGVLLATVDYEIRNRICRQLADYFRSGWRLCCYEARPLNDVVEASWNKLVGSSKERTR